MIEKYHLKKIERAIGDITEINDVLKRGKYLTMALAKDNHPYIVTMSYGFDERKNCLYMHAAKEGLKMDIIKSNPEVCATVIEDKGYVQRKCSHKYVSCVFEGDISVVEELEEKKHGMEIMLNHLEEEPSVTRELHLKNEEAYESFSILKIVIKVISGKKSL
ncbi:MAG: pyridoxamine 5'-phosphate oxidase family protein [Clostridia bacterium]|nr:pyridoxamine 5'-phosphate oxidase family protein [Clostridia bacterium]